MNDKSSQDGSSEAIEWLDEAVLSVAYIPDFRVDELMLCVIPDRQSPREAYHTLPPRTLDRWSTYFTKKGRRFLNNWPPSGRYEGPFKVRPGKMRLEILEPGRFRAPGPRIRLSASGPDVPLVSMEKKRPFDAWKPTYIKAVNFLKSYRAGRSVPRAVDYAIYEVEECGEIPGSVSWENAERILLEHARGNADVRWVLGDLFEKRPEEFPLGSQVYLRVLVHSGQDGFLQVCSFHTNPLTTKRCHVARSLGQAGRHESLEVLERLLEDESPEVRAAALQAIGSTGVPADHPIRDRMLDLQKSGELAHAVWATAALYRGGDQNEQKTLLHYVKESPLTLMDMGELGKILVDLEMVQAVPFLIKRLKSDRPELRDDAAETLRELTGLDLEFHGLDDAESRRDAIRQWSRWWEDYKRTRSKG